MSRQSASEIHQDKLPPGHYVVKDVLEGPRGGDGRFRVAWRHTDDTTWEPAEALRQVLTFREYCDKAGLDYTGQPRRAAAPSATPTTATAGTAASTVEATTTRRKRRPSVRFKDV